MSRVYFHSPSGDAELRGSERAHLGGLVNDVASGMLSIGGGWDVDRLKQFIHPDHYMARQDTTGPGWLAPWASSYETAFRVDLSRSAPLVQFEGREVDTFSLALNTAVLLGGDALRLAARIHGQCEIHGWVDGPNRAWLADMMQAAVDAGIFRKGIWYEDGDERKWSDQGWGDVITLLRSRDDEPVVMSYSVCDSFPDSSIGDWMPPWPEGVERNWRLLAREEQDERSTRSEEWYDLSSEEQWRISMAGLRASGGGLEMNPGEWGDFRFNHRLTVLDLHASDWEERFRVGLRLEPADAP